MSHKKKIYAILTVSAVAFFVSLILALPENFGLCSKADAICIDGYIYSYDGLATLLLMFSVPIFIISVAGLFLKEQILSAWFKFAIIFVPIAVILSIWMKAVTRGTLISVDEKTSTPVLASIFFIISFILIIFKSIQLHKEEN